MAKNHISLNLIEFENLKSDYESKLKEQKNRIFELVAHNEKLLGEVRKYERKEKEISKALLSAAEKAKEIEENAKRKYEFELSRIRNFGEKISVFYEKITVKYPIDKNIEQIKNFVASLNKIMTGKENIDYNINVKDEDVINKIKAKQKSDEIAVTSNFSPKERMRKFIAKETNGFCLDDVLNPKVELNLEELCKEMGFM